MASTRIKPFPLNGLVPYRGALYFITHLEVFSQGRLYRIGRYIGERYDERVMIDHWDLLENMESLAMYKVGDEMRHRELGRVKVIARSWRFSVGAVVYRFAPARDPQNVRTCGEKELAMDLVRESDRIANFGSRPGS